LESLKFDPQRLIPAIIQDYQTGEVLMLAYLNQEAWEKTLSTGKTHFYSRSRQKLWLKGETSGHFQLVKEIYLDCDNDTLSWS
jgi:phosphoribosyl-AMP cyclohydrolase